MAGIFVLGLPRSGTTWLANVLAANDNIAGVSHEKHYGIYESHFFDIIVNRYPNISNRTNYIEFISVMSKYDYYKIMNCDFNFMLSLNVNNYYDFFKKTHEYFKNKNNCLYWVEKTPQHIFYIDQLMKYFPNEKYIYIKRDLKSVIKSAYFLQCNDMKMGVFRKIRYFIKTAFYYSLGTRMINYYKSNILEINYEDMKSSNTLEVLEEYLNIKLEINKSNFEKNTSYSNKRKKHLSTFWVNFFLVMKYIADRLPLIFLKKMKKKHTDLPKWTFSLYDKV